MATTETRATCSAIIDQEFCFPDRGTIAGYAFSDRQVLLLDAYGKQVGPGQVGQIAIKSRYLNSGYLNRPELTEAKFLSDPNQGDERIYLTGDRGQLLPDGFLIHLGRMDRMVKIRGYRVELDDVERRLNEHPGIRIAAVEAWDRDDGEKYLAAYLVARTEDRPKADQIQSFLRETLPPPT